MRPHVVPLPPIAEYAARCAYEVDEALIWTDLAGTMAWANRRAQSLFGYAEAEMLGKPVMMLYSAANSPDLSKEIVDATLAGGWRGDILNVTKEGVEFPCQMTTTLIRDDAGTPIGIAGVLVDLRRLWGGTTDEAREAAGGRALCAIIGGVEGDAAAEAIAEGTGMDVVGVFDDEGRMAGYRGDPFLREVVARHPFPQTEGALAMELGAKGALQGKAKRGGVVALSVDSKEVPEPAKVFFRAALKILQIST